MWEDNDGENESREITFSPEALSFALVAPGSDLIGWITEIDIKDHNGLLYPLAINGAQGVPPVPAPTPVQITVGTNWELHIRMTGSATVSGAFTMAVSVVMTPGSGDLAGGNAAKKWSSNTGGQYSVEADFNVGPMPAGGVVINRIKMFMSPSATLTALPDPSLY
jgi:hypothetical protein